jgi:diguanylate cyclase (GGDEF)-like protein
MRFLRNARLVLVVTALLVGVAVWVTSTIQRHNADDARDRQSAAQLLLTGMLDQETGMRGFLLTERPDFLEPYVAGHQEYVRALTSLRSADHAQDFRDELAAAAATAARWQAEAQAAIQAARSTPVTSEETIARAQARKAVMDRFRAQQRTLAATLDHHRRDNARTASLKGVGISLAVVLLVALLGDLLIGRRQREERRRSEREADYRTSQGEFAETMQLVRSEGEAHEVLKRHLERSIGRSSVIVFNRNNSADRLEPTTRVDDAGIAERLEGATPESCLSVRLGRTHARAPGDDPLMVCEVCGATAGATVCRPLVVGTEVIGSVLVTKEDRLEDGQRNRLIDSVLQAAPVLANLRNLAIAETRAATDALTGLPNRRSIDDTLKRMVAQASRNTQPLSALMIDLDHFKSINDRFGHEHGDEALAAVGALLADSLRESDFAGRFGGEEFIVLAPATGAEGAATLAENLRQAVHGLKVTGIDARLTVSIGAATLPDAAADGATLLRMADRALYSAKERGRDRVEVAAQARPADSTVS